MKPTARERRLVRALAICGAQHADIADACGCTHDDLVRACPGELMAERRYSLTARQRDEARVMAGYGLDHEAIARAMAVPLAVLREECGYEMDKAHVEANALVAQRMYKVASAGNVTAGRFILERKAGWTERSEIDVRHSGAVAVLDSSVIARALALLPVDRVRLLHQINMELQEASERVQRQRITVSPDAGAA